MRLVLPLSEPYAVDDRPDGGWRAERDGLAVEASPLSLRPDNLIAWAQSVVRASAPADAIKVIEEKDQATDLGWPLHWIEVEVSRPEEPAARRLFAFYHFLDYAAHVVVDAADPAALAAARDDLLAALLRARPDWSTDEVVALAQLWA
jgi:hypothetical protein